MERLKLNIQLFSAEMTISRSQVGQPDEEHNTTTEKISVVIRRVSGSTYWQYPYTRNLRITCDGQTYDVATELPSNSSQVTYEHDFVIEHEADGTKTINFSALLSATSSLPELNASGTATLTPISQQSLNIFLNNSWKKCTPYIFTNGSWVRGEIYIFTNGEWRKGK